ncbi:MAG: type II toxin-antitoxin system RelE/ParE family toxin [Gemmatimonadetes bacterium]|nr:type II toxin-antitoxin system RelE/ParE family toxin [Gemmatimonadota bacterium]
MAEDRWLEFVWLPVFERSARKLLTEEDRRALEALLCEDPEAGDVIRGTGGFRKLRFPLTGRGKRGGARVIYFLDERCERVYMILVYAKGVRENLSRAEMNELARLARELKNEEC